MEYIQDFFSAIKCRYIRTKNDVLCRAAYMPYYTYIHILGDEVHTLLDLAIYNEVVDVVFAAVAL